MLPWSACTAASYWRTSDSCVSTCWLRDRILLEQRAIALDVDPRVLEQRLVARALAVRERQLHLERAGVDLRQEVARLHHLALLEHHLHQLAVDAAPDDDGVDGRHGAEREEVDVERALPDRARRRPASDGAPHRPSRPAPPCAPAVALAAAGGRERGVPDPRRRSRRPRAPRARSTTRLRDAGPAACAVAASEVVGGGWVIADSRFFVRRSMPMTTAGGGPAL